jgi:hypothetical protein
MNQIADIKAPGSCELQAPDRNWPLANCYVDLWIGVLDYWNLDPAPALAFTVAMDFEGDQFTFFKYPHEDLERLYGVVVHEISCYDTLERHTIEQLKRGRVVLAEVDGWYLPDTRATSYRMVHVKTTVGAIDIDPAARRLRYFHANGCYELSDDDYDGIFRRGARFDAQEDILPPFAELAYRRFPALAGAEMLAASRELLSRHLRRRPEANPFRLYSEVLPEHAQRLAVEGEAFFHVYAFHTTRQVGSNYELLGSYLRWLERHGEPDLEPIAEACDRIAAGTKALQFQLARFAAGRKSDRSQETVAGLAQTYDGIMSALSVRFG